MLGCSDRELYLVVHQGSNQRCRGPATQIEVVQPVVLARVAMWDRVLVTVRRGMADVRLCRVGCLALGADIVAADNVPTAAGDAVMAPTAFAADTPPGFDSGNTAWMPMAAVLGLMMTVPGIAMFYGGMVRRKNMLSIAGQCFAICCLVSVVWMIVGYSLAFSGDNEFVGNLDLLLLAGLRMDQLRGSFPEALYVVFQLGFGVVTAALITGAVADRMKFSVMLWFIALWSIIVYAPVVHWIWGGGFLKEQGVLDFAGGTIVHINAGVAGLVACLIVGKRKGYGAENMAPHNPLFSVIGVSLLWIGWFGFSAGSALGASRNAALAMLVTQTSAAAGGLTWMLYEWWILKKPSILGLVSGAVAGLVAITRAAGFVSPAGALAIGGPFSGAVPHALVMGPARKSRLTFPDNALRPDGRIEQFAPDGPGVQGAPLHPVLCGFLPWPRLVVAIGASGPRKASGGNLLKGNCVAKSAKVQGPLIQRRDRRQKADRESHQCHAACPHVPR